MKQIGFTLINQPKDFESENCLNCIHVDDSEEICTMRKCVHAINYLYDCYEQRGTSDEFDRQTGDT